MRRVAIIHYWLTGMRGGEKVLEALLALYPDADLFTHVYVPEAVSPAIRARRVHTSFIQKLPLARSAYRKYLPLMPLALRRFDLRGYDLVISSEAGPAKGVITAPGAVHICYCHTPMRYVRDGYAEYLREASPLSRLGLRLCAPALRAWDARSAERVHHFVANSHNVARRIKTYYGRESAVIHPPVDNVAFAPENGVYPEPEDYYLFVGQLTAYKRADIAIEACMRAGKKLVVVGDGPERQRLEALAGAVADPADPMGGSVRFVGRQEHEALVHTMRHCRALLFPGEEDFGITPLEAMAAGRPVLAFGRGGALETVRHGENGLFFERQDAESLMETIRIFESGRHTFSPAALTATAQPFSGERFAEAWRAFIAHIGAGGAA